MSHAAAVYRVRFHPRGNQGKLLLLGDLTDDHAVAAATVRNCLTQLDVEETEEGTPAGRFLRYVGSLEDPDDDEGTKKTASSAGEVAVLLEHGVRGVASRIVPAEENEQEYERRVSDTEWLTVGMVFRLWPARHAGLLAIHVPHGRGTKLLVSQELESWMLDGFGQEVTISLDPVVPADVVQEAIDSAKIDRITFVMLGSPADRFDTGQEWVSENEVGGVEVRMKPTRGGKFTQAALSKLHADPGHAEKLLWFNGVQYDQTKVRYEKAGGGYRTFNVERPTTGHPVTEDLADHDLQIGADGAPTTQSLLKSLRAVLDAYDEGAA